MFFKYPPMAWRNPSIVDVRSIYSREIPNVQKSRALVVASVLLPLLRPLLRILLLQNSREFRRRPGLVPAVTLSWVLRRAEEISLSDKYPLWLNEKCEGGATDRLLVSAPTQRSDRALHVYCACVPEVIFRSRVCLPAVITCFIPSRRLYSSE